MVNRLIIAAAGSGKTTYIINHLNEEWIGYTKLDKKEVV